MSPALTVAMPVYNGGRELGLSVRSLLNQTFTDWELIIIDDGSSDGAVQRLRELGDPRICIVADGKNCGLAARLNQIIGMARAPLLARMDHDDIAHPERLARQVAFLDRHPEVHLLGARCFAMSEDDNLIGELPFAETHHDITRRAWLGFHLAHPTWVGRVEWFRHHMYADPAPYCCEDQELLLRAHLTSHYHALPEPLLAYRIRTHIPLKKLLRTRCALVTVQLRYFVAAGRHGEAILALIGFLARTASDLLRKLTPQIRSDLRPFTTSEASSWSRILAAASGRPSRSD